MIHIQNIDIYIYIYIYISINRLWLNKMDKQRKLKVEYTVH